MRIKPVSSLGPDPFHYFTAAKDLLLEWANPTWVAFIDSDEFWLPRTGRMSDTSGLVEADVVLVPRYNAPVVLKRDGTLPDLPFDDLFVGPLHAVDEPPVPKVLVRPELVVEVGRGAHECTTTRPTSDLRAADVLITHLPFTTWPRFERKVDKVRLRMEEFGDRFGADQAAHWRRWLELAEDGRLAEDFDAWIMTPHDVEIGLADGILTTPRRLLAS